MKVLGVVVFENRLYVAAEEGLYCLTEGALEPVIVLDAKSAQDRIVDRFKRYATQPPARAFSPNTGFSPMDGGT